MSNFKRIVRNSQSYGKAVLTGIYRPGAVQSQSESELETEQMGGF